MVFLYFVAYRAPMPNSRSMNVGEFAGIFLAELVLLAAGLFVAVDVAVS